MSNTSAARTFPFSFLEEVAQRINLGRAGATDYAFIERGYLIPDDGPMGWWKPNRHMVTAVAS